VKLEQTLVLIKPDAFHRCLVGEIITRLEKKGLRMRAARLMQMDEALASKHYADHVGKDFYKPTVDFMTSAPIMAMVWEGRMAIQVVRKLAGKTNSAEAEAGTIRGDFSLSHRYNLIHAADSPETAKREIGLFFSKDDFLSYPTAEDLMTPFDTR
jgi:nucleoside-diphosphate kinase